MITRGRPTPPYRQVADILRERIRSGQIGAGEQLPSLLVLAGEFEVSMSTARKAVDLLKAEGLVTSVAGWGTFVRE
jgi:DNA-binding GntR family transcriptional regulator